MQQDRRSKLVEHRAMMSTAAPANGDSPMAPRAGADLRAARERLGWQIEDVAASLRIRRPHLEALEEGRIDLLPGNAYAVAFLRAYATALGLDPNEISRRFRAEAAEVNQRTELAFPAPVPQRGVPAGAVVLLGVILAIGAYTTWYRLSGDGRLPAETVTPVPERLAPLAQQAVSLPTVPTTGPGTPSPTASSQGPSGTTGTQPTAVAASMPGASQPAPISQAPMTMADAPPPPVPSISPTSAAAAPMPPIMATEPLPAAQSDQPRLVVMATADAWLQVRDRSGTILLNKILHAGDTWPVPAQPNLLLTTGNAGGTELVVDGTPTQALGGPGAVRRDLPLDPDLIKSGGLASQAALVQPVTVPSRAGQ